VAPLSTRSASPAQQQRKNNRKIAALKVSAGIQACLIRADGAENVATRCYCKHSVGLQRLLYRLSGGRLQESTAAVVNLILKLIEIAQHFTSLAVMPPLMFFSQ